MCMSVCTCCVNENLQSLEVSDNLEMDLQVLGASWELTSGPLEEPQVLLPQNHLPQPGAAFSQGYPCHCLEYIVNRAKLKLNWAGC